MNPHLVKFNMRCEYDTNSICLLCVLVAYNCVWVDIVIICITCLINGLIDGLDTNWTCFLCDWVGYDRVFVKLINGLTREHDTNLTRFLCIWV